MTINLYNDFFKLIIKENVKNSPWGTQFTSYPRVSKAFNALCQELQKELVLPKLKQLVSGFGWQISVTPDAEIFNLTLAVRRHINISGTPYHKTQVSRLTTKLLMNLSSEDFDTSYKDWQLIFDLIQPNIKVLEQVIDHLAILFNESMSSKQREKVYNRYLDVFMFLIAKKLNLNSEGTRMSILKTFLTQRALSPLQDIPLQKKMLNALLDHGADPHKKEIKENETPYAYALKYNSCMAEVIQVHTAKQSGS